MSGNQKNTPGYTASDIQKYRRGELSAREMHELEKAALEDPFLADALEGMELHQALPEPTTFARDLEELRTRLEARVAQKDNKKAIPFLRPRTRMAAAVILLAGLGTAAYFTLLKVPRQREPVASAISAEKDKTLQPAPVTTDSAAVAPPVAFNSRQHYLPSVRLIPRTSAPFGNSPATTQKDTVSYKAGNYALGASGSRARQVSDHLAFSGKVLDEHNRPVHGASVYLDGHSDISTVTDRHGLFNLQLHPKETDSALQLTVAHLGYEQTSIALNTLDQQNAIGNIIRLQPQHPSLDEVVVAGYGAHRKETLSKMAADNDEKIDTAWLNATPVTGRLLYLDYLSAARKKLSLDSTIKGDEIISFEINQQGALSSFRVEQSLSPAHDSSIIRLVREGPSWKLLRGRHARAAVRVSF